MTIFRIKNHTEMYDLVNDFNAHPTDLSIDIETTGLNSFQDSLISVAIHDGYNSFIIPANFASHLVNLTSPLILHNFKFDYLFLFRKGIDLTQHDCRDTMLLHHLLDENAPHSLDSLVKARYGDTYKELFWTKFKSFEDASQEEQDEYAAKDVRYTRQLYFELIAELAEAGIPDSLIKQVHDFAFALLDTEIQGVNIDLNRIKQVGIENRVKALQLTHKMNTVSAKEISLIEKELYEKEKAKRKTEKGKAGVKRPQFNWGSNSQLQSLLYAHLGCTVQVNEQRKATVDDAALSRIESEHEVVALLRELRAEEKIFNSFLEAPLSQAVKGVIYPSFNVNGTVTGRISASNPNLQQLPSTGNIRSIYVPRKGHSFISADYKQLEVTLAAHFSMDENLLRVVNEGVSLHDLTAEGVGCDRNTAKTLNFAIQYGAGVGKVQKILKCSKEAAEIALKKYWMTYPGLKKLIDRCHKCVDLKQAIQSPFGRQRHLTVMNPDDKWEVAGVKRQAFNSLIQGFGADITHTAFTQIANELKSLDQGRALFPVHDEILLEVQDIHVAYWNGRLVQIMQRVAESKQLRVPLTAEASGGMKSWLD